MDPWLTRNRRVCPVCKRKVFAADEVHTNISDSDSESEVDDRTPLVRASGTLTQGGTFDHSASIRVSRNLNLFKTVECIMRIYVGLPVLFNVLSEGECFSPKNLMCYW